MKKSLLTLAWLVAALSAGTVLADSDAVNGKKLYLGQASASFPSGSIGCNGCHNVNDKNTEMNVLFRGAAGDPDLIDFAINSNPASTDDMRPLYGIGGPSQLSPSDESDIAAYINSVVNPGSTGSGPTFSANPPSLSFGAVAAGSQSAAQTITIKNSGSSGTVNSVSSSSTEFLVAGGTCLSVPFTVAQNASCSVQVIFAPALSGSRSGTLTILDSGTPNPLTITLSGTGSASAPPQGTLAVPPSLSFGSQALFSQSAPKTLTLRNTGSATATIFSVANSNNAEFPVMSSNCSGPIPVGATCTVSVAFDPATPGARNATLTVTSDTPNSPQLIAVSGTGASSGGSGAGTKVQVIEYYNATFNHYFITSNSVEIGLLGVPPFQAWQPTGLSFNAYSPVSPPAGTVGICRFFNDHFLGISTHFYAPHGLGCEQTIAQFPDWTLEDPQLFFAYVPDAAGNCPGGTIPVYRLYNNGMGGAPNHRFTTSLSVRQTMLDKGYTPEGNGIGVGMCVPQ